MGLSLFIDYAQIATMQAENFSWKTEYYDYKIDKTSIGFGLMWREMSFLAAKRMDRSVNDWSFILQLSTFIDRDYPYPN